MTAASRSATVTRTTPPFTCAALRTTDPLRTPDPPSTVTVTALGLSRRIHDPQNAPAAAFVQARNHRGVAHGNALLLRQQALEECARLGVRLFEIGRAGERADQDRPALPEMILDGRDGSVGIPPTALPVVGR